MEITNISDKSMVSSFQIFVHDKDLTEKELGELDLLRETQELGPVSKEIKEWLQHKAPSIFVRKIEESVPQGYVIETISFNFNLAADFKIGNIGGEVNVVIKKNT
jgi:hypothetical protein